MPSGWTATDVGSSNLRGSASFSNNTFTVSGAGVDIWGTADQFMFVHRTLTGDGTIVARVGSVQYTDAWSKGGIMMRESLSAGSRNAAALVSAAKGVTFQRRTATGGTSASTIESGAAPIWLRLQRTGSTFTASRSADGVSWRTIASQSISMASTIYVGLAVTSHDPSALSRAVFSSVSVTGSSTSGSTSTAGALPSGWSSRDIGAVALAGAASYSSGVFTVKASGADIWTTADQFRYAYRAVSGDVDVVARVQSIQNVDPWTKAGVMIRRSLTASAGHSSLFVSAGKNLAHQARLSDGGSSIYTAGPARFAPWWVKLARRGTQITAFHSSDGVTWTKLGTHTLTLPSTFYVGLAVTSHKSSALAAATFSNVSVTAATTQVVNQPPTVSLTSPASGATFAAGTTISVAASAADGDGVVSRVDFYAGSTLIGSDTSSPFAISWANVAAGSYSLKAVARDNAGATTTSATRSITVSTTGNKSPAVSLSSPASGATFTAPASITVTATASDTDGTIASVEFYAGSTRIGTDTTSPYAVSWSSVPAGSYSLTAVARDNAGATTVSSARSVTVTSGTVPGKAVFTPSSNHSSAVDRYVFEVFASGADPKVSNSITEADLGKPAVVSGQITVDVSKVILALPAGSYIATVTAVGPGGTAQSAPSAVFKR